MHARYSVEPLASSRFPEAAALLARAFRNDPVIASILPGVAAEERVRKLAVMFEEMLIINARQNEPLGIVDNDSVLALAILHKPGTYPPSLPTQLALLWRALRKIGPRGLYRFITWSLFLSRHHPTTAHYYLETLGVEPNVQGQGLGSAMLRGITSLLDDAAAECALETANDRNVFLYQRFGFGTASEARILGAHVRFMVRQAVPRSTCPSGGPPSPDREA